MNPKKANGETLQKAFRNNPGPETAYELALFYSKKKDFKKTRETVERYWDTLHGDTEKKWWYSVKIYELLGIIRRKQKYYATSRRSYINALTIFNKNDYNKEARKLLGPRWLCARRLKKGRIRAEKKIPPPMR
ncbi:MAG: hypothetical protein QF775_01110 [archaeon]|jgi:hypothetical protein|nr:hypothetical protein [archaeon]HIK01437.1 hypothetical protein [Candidatus Undinarchaeales archaeon ERR594346 U_76725]|tara:strand:+ start:1547 stop:1945 length:399 start_codon:yes stop_codon:yes gene_type:complete